MSGPDDATQPNGEIDWEKVYNTMDYNKDGLLNADEHRTAMLGWGYDFKTITESIEHAFSGKFNLTNPEGLTM
jgi:hypothetical protein